MHLQSQPTAQPPPTHAARGRQAAHTGINFPKADSLSGPTAQARKLAPHTGCASTAHTPAPHTQLPSPHLRYRHTRTRTPGLRLPRCSGLDRNPGRSFQGSSEQRAGNQIGDREFREDRGGAFPPGLGSGWGRVSGVRGVGGGGRSLIGDQVWLQQGPLPRLSGHCHPSQTGVGGRGEEETSV